MSQLHARLGGKSAPGRVAIYGGAGVGKTALAREYARRHGQEYRIIAWIPAHDPVAANTALIELGARVGVIHPERLYHAKLLESLWTELSKHDPWLVILDDAPAGARALLPPAGKGRVLITSRYGAWHSSAAPILLGAMDRAEAITFLRQRTGREETIFAAGKLAMALQDQPLALEQAAACIVQAGWTFDQYLRKFESHWAELLQAGRPQSQYPTPVAMTWEILFRQIENTSPAAAELVDLSAMLGSAPISRSILREAAKIVSEPLAAALKDDKQIDAMLAVLRTFGLLLDSDSREEIADLQLPITDRDEPVSNRKSQIANRKSTHAAARGRSFSLSPVAATLARDRLEPEARQSWCRSAIGLIDKLMLYDGDDVRTWPACQALLPHVLTVTQHAGEADVELEKAARLMNDAAHCLYRLARYSEARTVLERALAMAHRAHGLEHPKVSAVANNLARVLVRLGALSQARTLLEAALATDEACYGSQHPHVAEVLNNYGACLHKAGDAESARRHFERALEIFRARFGPRHLKVAIAGNNVGYALLACGDLVGAAEQFADALTLAKASHGSNHPDTASILHNLGDVWRLRGDLNLAKQYLEQALAIDEAACGPNHPDVARDVADLGQVLFDQGHPAEARRCFERALAIDEAAFGPDHPELVDRLNRLGRALKTLGEVDRSVQCFERAANVLRQSRQLSDSSITAA